MPDKPAFPSPPRLTYRDHIIRLMRPFVQQAAGLDVQAATEFLASLSPEGRAAIFALFAQRNIMRARKGRRTHAAHRAARRRVVRSAQAAVPETVPETNLPFE
jgi:hypothetical protein